MSQNRLIKLLYDNLVAESTGKICNCMLCNSEREDELWSNDQQLGS